MNTKHSMFLLPLLLATSLHLPLPAKGQLLPLLSSFHSSGTGFNMSSVETSGLLARQQRVCPAGYPVMCSGSTCCPSGHNCCPGSMDCCPIGNDCVTIGAEKGCCPQVSQRCGGTQCCSPGASCCPGAAVGEGCCETGTTCCGNGCCRSPAVCGRDTDTRSLTCMVPNVTAPVEFDANKNRELAENMCRSMRARGVRGNEEVLTRRPYSNRQEEDSIRRKAKCGGRTRCATGYSCDEYPPASTEEGYDGLYGLDVFSCCIDEGQNTGGGRQLSSLYGRGSRALGAGSKFVVRVTNLDCSTVAPADPQVQCGPVRSPKAIGLKEKRQSDQGEANTLYPPLEGDPSSYTLVPFGDLETGDYQVQMTSDAQINSWQVIDAPALEITSGTTISPNTQTTFTFSLAYPAFGVGVVAFTNATSIKTQWSLTVHPLGTFTTSSSSPSSISGSSDSSQTATVAASSALRVSYPFPLVIVSLGFLLFAIATGGC